MPPMHVGVVEAIWIASNASTLILAVMAFFAARTEARDVEALNGRAREISAWGNVRRELVRVGVQALLLGVTIPGLFSDREVPLSLPVALLMIVPFLLLSNSALDARDRRNMTVAIAADLIHEREEAYKRLETATERILTAVSSNTALTQRAADSADRASDKAEAAVARADRTADSLRSSRATLEDTHEKVVDIHDALDGERPA